MSIGQHGKVAEDWGRLSREADRRLPGWRTAKASGLDLGRLVPELARALVSEVNFAPRLDSNTDRRLDAHRRLATPGADLAHSRALAKTIDVLSRGLRADRVSFYLSSAFAAVPSADSSASPSFSKLGEALEIAPGPFQLVSKWQRAGLAVSREMSPSEASHPVVIELDSLPDDGRPLTRGEPIETKAARGAGFGSGMGSRLRNAIFLPCLGASTLHGFFVVESRSLSTGLSGEVIEQAGVVGHLFAGFLDRHWLTIRLAEGQAKRQPDHRLEKLGLITSSLAHDFNNYLTAILGYADLASIEIAESHGVCVDEVVAGQQELAEIRDAATAAGELVEQTLSAVRGSEVRSGWIELGATIRGFRTMLEQVLGDEIDLEFRLGDSEEQIRVDPQGLESALLNLAANARQALSDSSSRGRQFELSIDSVWMDSGAGVCAASYLRLTVRDDGCGIEPEAQAKVFERFFTTRDSGTGLGLASVADFMAASGGTIQVESTKNVGTAFHLYFPLRSGSTSTSTSTSTPTSTSTSTSTA